MKLCHTLKIVIIVNILSGTIFLQAIAICPLAVDIAVTVNL